MFTLTAQLKKYRELVKIYISVTILWFELSGEKIEDDLRHNVRIYWMHILVVLIIPYFSREFKFNNKFKSFPSGHVATVLVLLVLNL